MLSKIYPIKLNYVPDKNIIEAYYLVSNKKQSTALNVETNCIITNTRCFVEFITKSK